MPEQLQQPKILQAFNKTSAIHLRRGCLVVLTVYMCWLGADWWGRFALFKWQRRWLSPPASTVPGDAIKEFSRKDVPAKRGGDLSSMMPPLADVSNYAEHHPAFDVWIDPSGYQNTPLPEGGNYQAVVIGDSFSLSSGTQTLSQAVASVGGWNIYNHARRAAGPFIELKKFVLTRPLAPPPRFVIWDIPARELSRELFWRQPVAWWFQLAEASPTEPNQPPAHSMRLQAFAPRNLHASWPSTSLTAYIARKTWGMLEFHIFREWPHDVMGGLDPRYGPMLFYRENLRVMPNSTTETDAEQIIFIISMATENFAKQGQILIPVLIPEKEQIHIQALPAKLQAAMRHGPEFLAAIEQGLRNQNVHVVNLMPAFQQATAEGTRLYWKDDTHWNDAGIRLAAEQIWAVMEPLSHE